MEVDDSRVRYTLPFWWNRSGARALELHGLYCWYHGGLDTLSVGNVLGQGFSRIMGLEPRFPQFSFDSSFHFFSSLQNQDFVQKALHHDHGSPGNGKV